MARLKKTTRFFRHAAMARDSRKIKILRKVHKNDGYAAYFCLMEIMCQADDFKLQLGSPATDKSVAEECGLRDIAQLYAIIETCCRFELFDDALWKSQRIVFSNDLSNGQSS